MRRLPLVPALLLLGCSSPTAPTGLPSLEFESRIVFGAPTLPAKAVGSAGKIVVTGVIPTAGTGFTLTGHLTVTGSNMLTLEIHAEDNAPGVPFQVQNFYKAEIRRLASGNYDLTVIYNVHDPAPGVREQVYRNTVHVD